MILRADSLAATHAIASAVAGLSRAGDIIVLAGEMGAGKTAFAQGFGRALGITEAITSPTFTLVHSYPCPDGRRTLHHADIYRLDRTGDVDELGLHELAEFGGTVLVEWGDVAAAGLGDHLEVRLLQDDDLDDPTTSTTSTTSPMTIVTVRATRACRPARPSGRARPMTTTSVWTRRGRSSSTRPGRRGPAGGIGSRANWRRTGAEAAMLILGIETATEQVGVAIGGHEGVIATFEVARGRRHAEILTPAIEFVLRQADVEIDEIGCVAVDVGPGLFTGMRVGLASAKALALALRIPMIGISSLDLLAFPCRHTDRVIVPVIDARKSEVFWAMYRQVPGGVQRVSEPTVGPVDELVADLLARSQEVLCVGDGAAKYQDEIMEGYRCEISAPVHPSVGALVQLAHAQALREEWVRPDEIEPVYLRAPDAQINWSTREARP